MAASIRDSENRDLILYKRGLSSCSIRRASPSVSTLLCSSASNPPRNATVYACARAPNRCKRRAPVTCERPPWFKFSLSLKSSLSYRTTRHYCVRTKKPSIRGALEWQPDLRKGSPLCLVVHRSLASKRQACAELA